jgi:hypothetical protein
MNTPFPLPRKRPTIICLSLVFFATVLLVGSSGNVYIADSGNNAVRKDTVK